MTRGDESDPPEPPELFRPRPGDDIVEPLFGALRGEGEPPTVDGDRTPHTGWQGALFWRLRLLFRRGRRRGTDR